LKKRRLKGTNRPAAKSKHFKIAASAGRSPEQLPPIFSLRHTHRGYSVEQLDKSEKAAFADTLHTLSQLTWNQLHSCHRHKNGYEKIENVKAPIPKGITEDVTFIAFRFDGKKPMVGFRDGDIFHIVWFDKDYCVYDHGGS